MNRLFAIVVAGLLAIVPMAAAPVAAAPISYSVTNVPLDTPQALAAAVVGAINSSGPAFAYTATCSGTTTATCTGTRFVVSVTGLTTAAGVTSASMAVTNTSVAANSIVFCQGLGYGGAGNPQPVKVVPTASTLTFAVQNTHASAALDATVPVACFVYN